MSNLRCLSTRYCLIVSIKKAIFKLDPVRGLMIKYSYVSRQIYKILAKFTSSIGNHKSITSNYNFSCWNLWTWECDNAKNPSPNRLNNISWRSCTTSFKINYTPKAGWSKNEESTRSKLPVDQKGSMIGAVSSLESSWIVYSSTMSCRQSGRRASRGA